MRTSNWKSNRFFHNTGKCQVMKGTLFTKHGTVKEVAVTRKTGRVRGLGKALEVEKIGVDCFIPKGLSLHEISHRKIKLAELAASYG